MKLSIFALNLSLCILSALLCRVYAADNVGGAETETPGLIGVYFSSNEFTNPKGLEPVDSLELDWHEREIGYGNWSAEWRGLIQGPVDGEVLFEVTCNRPVSLAIDGSRLFDLDLGGGQRTTIVPMRKGEFYPIVARLTKRGDRGPVSFHVRWSWGGQDPEPIPTTHLRYTHDQLNSLAKDFPDVAEPPGRDPELVAQGVLHAIVYHEPGRFGGWPANNGIWVWGNEILVGFQRGYFKASKITHSIDVTRREEYVFARTLDGGESWRIEEPEGFGQPSVEAMPCCPEKIDFSQPGFALRSRDNRFYYSYDKGRTWKGPFVYPSLATEMTSRTDYRVDGPANCLFFLSALVDYGELGVKDRAFCAKSVDGGQSFQFLGWMSSEPGVRSVMPSTVSISETDLVSVLRRREDRIVEGKAVIRNWLDAYGSWDGGRTWEFLSRIAETDSGKNNGNPPSLVRTADGTLVVTYGYRATPYGIRAKVSADGGRTWGPEIALRSDARTWDFGYPRTAVRPDGRLVTVYYYTTSDRIEQHIEATVWDPVSAAPFDATSKEPH